jgi:hypothetical protein
MNVLLQSADSTPQDANYGHGTTLALFITYELYPRPENKRQSGFLLLPLLTFLLRNQFARSKSFIFSFYPYLSWNLTVITLDI